MIHIKENLLVRFSVVSLAVLATIAVLLAMILANRVQVNAQEALAAEAVEYASGRVLRNVTPADLEVPMTGSRYDSFHAFVQESIASERTARVKLWATDGTVIYSNDPAGVGLNFSDNENLRRALRGETAVQIKLPQDPENERERYLGTLMEVYTPILFPGATDPQGILEIYQYYAPTAERINDIQRWIFGSIGIGFVVLYAALISVVKGGWRTINRQQSALATINTDLQAANQGLQETEERFRAVAQSATDAIIISDRDGNVFFWNKGAQAMFGYSEEVLGKSLTRLMPARYRDDHRSGLARMASTGESHLTGRTVELHGLRKDGHEFPLELSLATWKIREVPFYSAIIRDITKRKRAEQEQERLHEGTRRRAQRLAALRAVDRTITASRDLKFTLKVLLEQVRTQLGVDAANVLLLDPQTQKFEYAAGQGFRTAALQHTRLSLGEGYAGRAALERQMIGVPDLRGRKTDFLRSPLFAQEEFITYYGVPLIAKGQVKGVLEVFQRSSLVPDQEWLDFLEALAGQAAIAIDNATLFNDLQRSNADLVLAYDATLEGWSRALELRDDETEGHTQRVTEMTLRLARAMGLDEAQQVHVRRGALLHDIGKIGVPDRILLKAAPLTDDDWAIMRQHPVYAYEMLSPIAYLRPALDIPYCHHEKWDGTGYPRGLKGEQIPLAARIFAVVDVWDALTSDRPYREAWPKEKALAYLQEQSGKHFDPQVVEVFLTFSGPWTEDRGPWTTVLRPSE